MTTETSENLGLPYIMNAQAQKHVTHNEAIRMLDALIHPSVATRPSTTPPSSDITAGARYIVEIGGTGAWHGHDNAIAAWQDEAWVFYPPRKGWTVWVEQASRHMVWTGERWQYVS